MDSDQNWYRQLLALTLLSAAKTAVEFITNPSSRQDASKQLKGAFAEIDYDSLAKALTRAIDEAAHTSKHTLDEAIDTLRDRGVDLVDEAKEKALKETGQKKGGRKMRFLIGLMIGGVIAYFILDEQRRDDLLDKLTGASGPISQTTTTVEQQASSVAQQASQAAQGAAQQAASAGQNAADKATTTAKDAADKATAKAKDAKDKTEDTPK
jgi:hypothetical protein